MGMMNSGIKKQIYQRKYLSLLNIQMLKLLSQVEAIIKILMIFNVVLDLKINNNNKIK